MLEFVRSLVSFWMAHAILNIWCTTCFVRLIMFSSKLFLLSLCYCIIHFLYNRFNQQHLQCDSWCWSSWGHLSFSEWPAYLCHLHYSIWDWSNICESTKQWLIHWYQSQQPDSPTQYTTTGCHCLLLSCVIHGSTNAGHILFRYESLLGL